MAALCFLPLSLILCSLPLGWAIICYHCDSIALEACAMTLGEVGLLPYVECSNGLTCAMSIVDSITYRGCGSDTPTNNATYRKSCESNLCNAGVYPPGRLKCHHCEGESCVDRPAGKPRPCRHHYEEDQCYTEVLSSSSAYRGCKSDSNHTIPATGIILCDYNGCNDELAARMLSCVKCDSQEARGCKMDLFQVYSGKCNVTQFDECQVEVLLTQPQSCFTYHRLDRVIRGCSAELPPEVAADLPNPNPNLVECDDGDNCNMRCLPQQRCLNCDSASNEVCRTNATALTTTICGSAEASSCYACEYQDWQVRRGCGAPPSGADISHCYQCEEDGGCNNLPFSRCYRCDTQEAGAACATWQRPGQGGIYVEECLIPAAPCLVLSYFNGTTERGCQRLDFNCNSTDVENCRSCVGSFCNKGAFPAERLQCHQCVDCEQLEATQNPLPCALPANEPTDAAAACLEYYDSLTKRVVRGCRSNVELYYECLLRSGQNDGCRTCHSHGCNHNPLTKLRQSLELVIAPRSAASALLASTKSLLWFTVIYRLISTC